MNMHARPLNERISALMDGDLPAAELDALLDDLGQGDSSANAWHLYHVAGDVMRSQALAPLRSDLAFLQRLEPRLAREVVTAQVMPSPAPALPGAEPFRRLSSNGPWRWVASATFMLLAGVVSVGMWWTAGSELSPQLAEVTVPAVEPVAAQVPGVMLRDPELDALMAAHQQMGGHSAWQMPSGFLRNATYERPAR
ncbi:sigma-E factor negative regulatory protein [Rhodoferax sp. TH121]|uniref:sigma-E factor negative regulatory protein n=1 Tax=Rhodoferax sp. TH121 TaxID=2022803 RepID=UPI0020CC023F|nr:sigma-E factor negative regulatory protein [Rhodoferax sp. TH121]